MANQSSSETQKSGSTSQTGAGSSPQTGASAAQSRQGGGAERRSEGTSGQSRERSSQQQTGGGALQRRSVAPMVGAFGLSPFSLMRRMMEDMDRLFGDVSGGALETKGWPQASRGALGAVWSPAIEAFERDGNFVVRADLPGLSPDDVRIEATDDSLVIEGERRSEIEVEGEGGVYRSERTYGRFSREIPLPDGADPSKAQARFENGVLEVTIPMPQELSRRRRIEIQGSPSSGKAQRASGEPPVH